MENAGQDEAVAETLEPFAEKDAATKAKSRLSSRRRGHKPAFSVRPLLWRSV